MYRKLIKIILFLAATCGVCGGSCEICYPTGTTNCKSCGNISGTDYFLRYI